MIFRPYKETQVMLWRQDDESIEIAESYGYRFMKPSSWRDNDFVFVKNPSGRGQDKLRVGDYLVLSLFKPFYYILSADDVKDMMESGDLVSRS